ncbi:hypothetical protein SAY87_030644 [Trapa incisa]|uniref:AB hydrolase-1 domain-containing protein n=1 Tax=Trapa incisa TaxID=236973 RepID=A0AAN7KNJ7_9MYRT|nr:hypothetical protein SAY87_030644 [Trapa incisa]
MIPTVILGAWARRSAESIFSAINVIVFLCLDGLECILCMVYRFLDSFFEGKPSSCYCVHDGEICDDGVRGDVPESEDELSESLHGRKNVIRGMKILKSARRRGIAAGPKKRVVGGGNGVSEGIPVRWSDCRCQACISWINDKEQKLHLAVKESSIVSSDGMSPENVIFLHGFLSSSSLWTELVFPNLSESVAAGHRLFAVDLLGFGKSPKPRDCFYTLRDHIEMIEKSVISPFQLDSFHIVAHSMGCVIAVALASKYHKSVKSVTLTASPYFPSAKGDPSLTALRTLAGKRMWPPQQFGTSVMSWYEHLGRCICFIICRNHRTWEMIIRLVTRRRHTHHSAWHTMHNVICGGMKLMDGYLETLRRSQVKIFVVHGDRDRVVPLEHSIGIKLMVPDAVFNIIRGANHNSVILGREREYVRFLERAWDPSSSTSTKIRGCKAG